MNFESFNLEPRVFDAVAAMNFHTPTPVQQQVIPAVIQGKDVIACAQTGTGKTAAFLIPVIHSICQTPDNNQNKALIIAPTRELAQQIAQQTEGFGYFAGISSLAIYGGNDGMSFENEKKALTRGADILICTPGRLLAHINMGYVDFSQLHYLILDEADRMLDMGFYEDIMKIVDITPRSRQTLLFSATMPADIRKLARKILRQPSEINISLALPPDRITQNALFVAENSKIQVVSVLLKEADYQSVLIFCDTKLAVKNLTRELKSHAEGVAEIHSDLDQTKREEVLNAFRNRQVKVLVATDIVSRGIDVEDIDVVINYTVPHDAEDYIHRIGRTARAQAQGMAITLIGEKDRRRFANLEVTLGLTLNRLELQALPSYPANSQSSGDPCENTSTKKRRFKRKFRPKQRGSSNNNIPGK